MSRFAKARQKIKEAPRPWYFGVGWVVGCVVGAVFLFTLACFFLIKRSVVKYHTEHVFPVSHPGFFQAAHALADPLPVRGNKIDLLQNGDEIFPAMLKAIAEAETSINFEAYLFESGELGNQFMEAFIAKAQSGVKVRVLLDGAGSGTGLDNSDVDRLIQGGCEFSYYHPVISLRFDRLNIRSHRRVMVVDGRIAFTGSVGFSDFWRGNAASPDYWRDMHARLEGPIVSSLQAAFQHHWFKATGFTLDSEDSFPELKPAGNLKAQVIISHAFMPSPMTLVQAVTYASATKSIYISNAYCAPSDQQVQALEAAVKRGVKVILILPGEHNDVPLTKAAGRSSYGDLLRGGIEIYEYQPTMLHSKTMVVDGIYSVFGSSNFDARSIRINEELDISVLDETFGREMEKIFLEDLKKSKPYTLADFEKRPLKERIVEWLIIPFHSQL